MTSLSGEGKYEISPEMRERLDDFYGGFADEETVAKTISDIYRKDQYVIDPHTAVAAAVSRQYREKTGDHTPMVIASTASPYKFARSVLHAIDAEKYDAMSDLEQFDALHQVSGAKIPDAIEEIKNAPVRHKTVAEVPEMKSTVCRMLGLE